MLGIDVSNNNDGAFDDTAQFAIIKATEGTSFVDKLFPQYVARCVDLRIPWGGYHFAHPDVNAAADEARHFLGRDVGSLPAVDIEPRQNANPLTIMGPARLAAWITTWCNIVYARTSIFPLVYMPRSYATALLPYLDPHYPLWLATLDYAKPTVWKGREVAIVQYAIENGIDRNESFIPLGTGDNFTMDQEAKDAFADVVNRFADVDNRIADVANREVDIANRLDAIEALLKNQPPPTSGSGTPATLHLTGTVDLHTA